MYGWESMDAGLVAIGRRAAESDFRLQVSDFSDRPNTNPAQESSEAEGDQTERVISERVPASEGGARALGTSEPREPGIRLQESDFS